MAGASASEWVPFRRTAIAFALVGVALAVFELGRFGGQVATRAVADASFVVFSTAAAVACFRTARRRPHGRRLPWWLLCSAATCYAVGNLVWFYYQVLVPETQTYPGPADVFYVAVVPFAVAAMLTLPSRRLSTAGLARAIADGAIVGAALFFISWILVVGPLVGQLGEASWNYLGVYLYYPLTDILVISVATGVAVRAAGRERVPMLLVATGFVAIACADTGIGYLALQGREAAGSGLDLGWTYGYMLLGLAALTPVPEHVADHRADPRALVREVLPYVPVVAVLVVAASNPSRLTDDVLVGVLIAVVVLLVARHMLTMADNIHLTGHLQDLVRVRTHDLERLSGRHQSILDGAGEGIVGIDGSGRVTFANPAAARLLGREPADLVGSGFHALTQPHGADGEPIAVYADPVVRALADGVTRTLTDITYQRADGAGFAVELTVAPAPSDAAGSGGVLMFRDVTERRAVDRMKDEFVSVVSHELRTPLTSVRGALGLLQGGLLEMAPTAQRMMHIAVQSTDRLIRLINDILDVERIAAGKLALKRQVWPAADLIDRAVGEMHGLADQAEVRLDVGPVTGSVDADRDRIEQTLINLLSNAIKFSPAGGTVRVAAAEQDDVVLFRVSDQGPGIPPDQLEAVFGRFAQLDSSDTREKEGSGLGLAICRGIVEQHGGRIWAENQVGRGAVLQFTLPKVDVSLAGTPPGTLSQDGTLPTVLVCDDDSQTREVIGELLRSHGYSVTGVGTGEEAVALAHPARHGRHDRAPCAPRRRGHPRRAGAHRQWHRTGRPHATRRGRVAHQAPRSRRPAEGAR
jgi:PAS domain S-box-containing protein